MTGDIIQFLGTAWDAANAAGEIIRGNWQQPKTIDYKGAIDLVTTVDRDCERKIIEVIRQNFPNHSILAEEETDVEGKEHQHRWIVDPLGRHDQLRAWIPASLDLNRSPAATSQGWSFSSQKPSSRPHAT